MGSNIRRRLILLSSLTGLVLASSLFAGSYQDTVPKNKDDDIELAAAMIAQSQGDTVYRDERFYDGILIYSQKLGLNPEAIARILITQGPEAFDNKWVNAVSAAKSKGISDVAIGRLVSQYGKNVSSTEIARAYQVLTEKGFTNGEAKALLIQKSGSDANSDAVLNAQLFKQYLNFISTERGRRSFINFAKKSPRSYQRFLAIRSYEGRVPVYRDILNRY